MFCPECGTKVVDEALFCGNCGASLKKNSNVPVKKNSDAPLKKSSNAPVKEKPSEDTAAKESQDVGAPLKSKGDKSHRQKKKSGSILIPVIIIAVIVVLAAVYVAVAVVFQKNIDSTSKSVSNKLLSREIELSEDNKNEYDKASKASYSWNIIELSDANNEMKDIEELVEKLVKAKDNYDEYEKDYEDLKIEETEKSVSCDSQKEYCKQALEDLKDCIDSNVLLELNDKTEAVKNALDDYEDAIIEAYENGYTHKYAETDDSDEVEIADYVFEDSDSKLYTQSEVNSFFEDLELTKLEKYALSIIAINEIYARHGMTFERPTIQKYFNNTEWYENKNIPQEKINSKLSDTELKNIDKMAVARKYYWEKCQDYSQVNTEKPKADDFSADEYEEVMELLADNKR
jgi:Tfp pilus assembly protein PilN